MVAEKRNIYNLEVRSTWFMKGKCNMLSFHNDMVGSIWQDLTLNRQNGIPTKPRMSPIRTGEI